MRQRVDEVLHYLWDPIGVAGVPQARGEYDSYVLPILGLLIEGGDADVIARRLMQIEGQRMGLPTNRGRAMAAAEALIRRRDRLLGADA